MMMMTMPHDKRRRQPQSSALRRRRRAAAAAAADAQSDRRGAVRNDGVGCVASEPEITMQTLGAAHTTRLSASNTVKKAALLTLNAQTRRLLRILGGDVSQKDQSKCHS